MPAPSLNSIYEFEALVPAAALAIIAPYRRDIHTPGEATILPRTSLAARYIDYGTTGRLAQRGVHQQIVTDFAEYQGMLELDVGVAREENAPAVDISSALTQQLAVLRTLFLNHPPPFAQRLPYWQVTEIRPQPTTYDLDPTREIDLATLTWQLTLSLLPGTMPEVV